MNGPLAVCANSFRTLAVAPNNNFNEISSVEDSFPKIFKIISQRYSPTTYFSARCSDVASHCQTPILAHFGVLTVGLGVQPRTMQEA
jgi:hypothetical protein